MAGSARLPRPWLFLDPNTVETSSSSQITALNEKLKHAERPVAENLLDYAPQPVILWQMDANGHVVLKLPRFNSRLLKSLLLPRMKNPHLSIHLDVFGTWVWQEMDGKKTVAEIAKSLSVQFGDAVEPVYERLGLFINLLARRKFIILSKNQEPVRGKI